MPINGSSRTQSLQEDGKNLDWENMIERKNLRKRLQSQKFIEEEIAFLQNQKFISLLSNRCYPQMLKS